MKLKKLTIKQCLSVLASLTLVMITFLISTESYFNNQEIKMASNGCFEQGGYPVVETTSLTLNYSFSCEYK